MHGCHLNIQENEAKEWRVQSQPEITQKDPLSNQNNIAHLMSPSHLYKVLRTPEGTEKSEGVKKFGQGSLC